MPTRLVTATDSGTRLDLYLATCLPAYSRARWQQLIREGRVTINAKVSKANALIKENDRIDYTVPPPQSVSLEPQELPLEVLYEDRDIVVINKPPGLLVHPAPGHPAGTLVNALLFHCKDLAGIGGELRPGIVHRLDKDTSGVLIVAKNEAAVQQLTAQFKNRLVRKEYLVLVWGRVQPSSGVIETLIGRDPRNRKKMSAKPASGRPAVSRYTVLEQFDETALLQVRIETGRTHQIRVHMAHMGHPVVGDPQYGGKRAGKPSFPVSRQMLHASALTLNHPRTNEPLIFSVPMPRDMDECIAELRTAKRTANNKKVQIH